jgi:glycosyltransferase involved in cell wall biosynthesis
VDTDAYYQLLLSSLHDAEAVLVLNPLTQSMLSPYARRVEVVTWGMDPTRFPWPPPDEPRSNLVKTIFQAGVINEPMKGFDVLHAACQKLWQKRQDFRLVATGIPAGSVDAFTDFVGWISQEDLPRYYRAADLVAVPTVAQEGLSRTSVEAMASGRAVIASRIGGLPHSVDDGATGVLCRPGDIEDWCQKLDYLLTEDGRRQEMGQTGRQRFEERFAWDKVIERDYRPLFVKSRLSSQVG